MAIIKHIACKNANYDGAFDYLTTKYDEFECRPILDEHGRRIPRENIMIDGILCDPFTFGTECGIANRRYSKNQQRNEIKTHHYIISFDPKDKTDNGLTMEKAQELGMDFAKRNFSGHQTLVCTHPDGHNGTGNIHVHIIINSLRIENVEYPPFKERKSDCLAGMKHHVSKQFLDYLKQDVMDMCRSEKLYQVDLLNPAKVRVTDREYRAQRREQKKLEKGNSLKESEGVKPEKTKYETDKEILRNAVRASLENSHSIEELKDRLLSDYGVYLFENRGRFSFQMPGRTKAIRARQLGTDFEKEAVQNYFEKKKERIEMPIPVNDETVRDTAAHGHGAIKPTIPDTRPQTVQSQKTTSQVKPVMHNTHENPTVSNQSVRLITDLEKCIKAEENPYYTRKVKITNLKEMAKTLNFLKENGIGSEEELVALVKSASKATEAKRDSLKATEARLETVNLLIRNSGQYFANKKVYTEYLKARNKKAFREAHTTEILLYESARRELKELSGGKPIPNMKQLKAEKEKLVARDNAQYEEFTVARSRLNDLRVIQQNVVTILHDDRQHTMEREYPEGR